jgi:hypothetical protein
MEQLIIKRKSLFDISLRDIERDKMHIVIKESEPAYNGSFCYYYCIIRKIESPENIDPTLCVWIHAMSYDGIKWFKTGSTLSWFRSSKIERIDDNLQYEDMIDVR